ncbi:hypothetical protein K1719_026169 [Acacia pycnantha]|nr:hypothetical protein K1719_026169 [Acacia pycnantha]
MDRHCLLWVVLSQSSDIMNDELATCLFSLLLLCIWISMMPKLGFTAAMTTTMTPLKSLCDFGCVSGQIYETPRASNHLELLYNAPEVPKWILQKKSQTEQSCKQSDNEEIVLCLISEEGKDCCMFSCLYFLNSDLNLGWLLLLIYSFLMLC